eukprot:CAMPEP_0114244256 /NCGR_PEP_ID=MMETSP0058-20121206/11239_1 /TAXON_ID=36894 /ORGANISM="Pyramimonas parkeae, CCMP726" /LENGTH=483 /DNA_ID=CAMNT_0001357177 /DNA_START=355 /DNA_END=1806 /DNA_ORIENTATION=-
MAQQSIAPTSSNVPCRSRSPLSKNSGGCPYRAAPGSDNEHRFRVHDDFHAHSNDELRCPRQQSQPTPSRASGSVCPMSRTSSEPSESCGKGCPLAASTEAEADMVEAAHTTPTTKSSGGGRKTPRANRKLSIYQELPQQAFASFHLQVDCSFIITGCDEEACRALKCQKEQLVGQPIVVLMSPMIAKMHDEYFARVRDASREELGPLRRRLERSMSKANHFVVYDFHRQPFMCELQVSLFQDLSSIVTLTTRRGQQCPMVESVPRCYLRYINEEPGLYVNDYDDVTCIMMDLANSTNFCVANSARDTAAVYFDVHKIAKRLVLDVYPYVYIHELIGDAVFLVVNASFMVTNLAKPGMLAMHVATSIQAQVDAMLKERYGDSMYMRAGVASGSVCAGVIDGRSFRMFGSTVHLSQRLEAMCPKGHVALDEAVCSMLRCQATTDGMRKRIDEVVADRHAMVKGFGPTDYYTVSTDCGIDWLSELT